jgi:hypothetical protein
MCPIPRLMALKLICFARPCESPSNVESINRKSYDYQRMLDRHGFISSMSGKGNCYDNAMVETLFKTIKSELIWRTSFQSRREAAIARYIDGFYNPIRRHSALAYKSPKKFEDEANHETWLSTNRRQVQAERLHGRADRASGATTRCDSRSCWQKRSNQRSKGRYWRPFFAF